MAGDPIIPRPVVRAFAEAMERELRENEHKGGRDAWRKCYAEDLLDRVKEETNELAGEVCRLKPDPQRALSEAADVANMVMMVADVLGGLEAAPQDAELEAALKRCEAAKRDRAEAMLRSAQLAEAHRMDAAKLAAAQGFADAQHGDGTNEELAAAEADFLAAFPPTLGAVARINSKYAEEDADGVCEHGDHAAPLGQRFCSKACADCEGTPQTRDDQCAGVCGHPEEP